MKPSYLYTFLLCLLGFILTAQNTGKGTKDKAEEILNLQPSDYKHHTTGPKTYPEPKNWQRFTSSPCYTKLGYNIKSSEETWERTYCDCENEYYQNLYTKIGFTTLALAFLGGLTYLVLKK